eukprot:scaffold1839_cov382-Prasinococcus_capsulatus_cf.AAC.32
MSNWSPPQRIYSGVKHKLEDSASISSGRIWNGKYPGLASSPTWEISAWPGWRRCLAAANPVATRGIVACMCVMYACDRIGPAWDQVSLAVAFAINLLLRELRKQVAKVCTIPILGPTSHVAARATACHQLKSCLSSFAAQQTDTHFSTQCSGNLCRTDPASSYCYPVKDSQDAQFLICNTIHGVEDAYRFPAVDICSTIACCANNCGKGQVRRGIAACVY